MAKLKPRPLWRLEDLLVQCFQPEELRRSLLRWFPVIEPEIPAAHGAPAQFAHIVVTLLDHYGFVDVPLFSHLLESRPLRRSQIFSVSGALSIATDAVDDCTGELAPTRVFLSAFMVEPRLIDELERLLLERERCGPEDPQHAARSEDIERIAAQVRTRRSARAGVRVAGTVLEYPIGSGTFGRVWRSRNAETGAPLATKLFDLNRLTEGVMLWRFRRSIRALQALNKYEGAPASIARVATVSDDGLAFSMELCSQESLVTIARRNWSLDAKLRVFNELCRAVAFAHRAGVIHRDIKPSNVLLDADLHPVLIDFDVADVHFLTQHKLTAGGLGTPLFAAPEQLECAADVDERADVYSLGRLLHFMLLERMPSLHFDQDALLASLWTFPPSLYAAVRKATQRDPDDRYARVEQLLHEVQAYKTGWSALKAKARKSAHWVARNAVLLLLAVGGTTASTIYAFQQRVQAVHNEELRVTLSQVEELTTQLTAAREEHRRVKDELVRTRELLAAVEKQLHAQIVPVSELRRLEDEKNKYTSTIQAFEQELKQTEERLDQILGQLNSSAKESRDVRGPPRQLQAGPVSDLRSPPASLSIPLAGDDRTELESPSRSSASATKRGKKRTKGKTKKQRTRKKLGPAFERDPYKREGTRYFKPLPD